MQQKWFIDQLEEYQEEQHSVLNSIPFIGPFLQQCFIKEEDEDGLVEVPFCLYQIDQQSRNALLQQAQLCGVTGTSEQKTLLEVQFVSGLLHFCYCCTLTRY